MDVERIIDELSTRVYALETRVATLASVVHELLTRDEDDDTADTTISTLRTGEDDE